jgi:ubiquinone/menaquinone biosynthesis C-methylase UbiE
MSALVHNLYNDHTVEQWQHEKTMMHGSGIWGRQPVLKYLREKVLRKGNVVVDLGAGAGYPSLLMSACVGSAGRVIGIDLSEAMIVAARAHCRADNLSFEHGDITQQLLLADELADVVTGFMVLHNLHLDRMRVMFGEVGRILKSTGRAVFLTMHPEAFEEHWELDFLSYDAFALRRYHESLEKEDVEIPGRARNSAGGENSLTAVYHSRQAIIQAAHDAALDLADERDLWIDRETAVEVFGAQSIHKMPTVPIYWMLVLKRATQRAIRPAQPFNVRFELDLPEAGRACDCGTPVPASAVFPPMSPSDRPEPRAIATLPSPASGA